MSKCYVIHSRPFISLRIVLIVFISLLIIKLQENNKITDVYFFNKMQSDKLSIVASLMIASCVKLE